MDRRKRTGAIAKTVLVFFIAGITATLGWVPSSAASDAADVPGARIQEAIQVLLRTPSGRAMIEKAMKNWKVSLPDELTNFVRPSDVSRTDAVLTRHYNALTGVETRERQITVYIRQDQSVESMALDIAHELVHATSRPVWDPYDPDLTAGVYIKNSIEGQGGEVQAVRTECQVALELSNGKTPLHRCGAYLDADRKPDLRKITADFYRVGQWRPYLKQALGSQIGLFPLLSADAPRLYSSTGNAPYPAALLREFRALTQIACENSKRRASLWENRSVASVSSMSGPTFQFLQRRCQ